MFYTNLYDRNGGLLDQSMACFFKGFNGFFFYLPMSLKKLILCPKTFTGEDGAELYLHGSRAVVNAVFKTLSEIPGLESAKAGEFTKRYFLGWYIIFPLFLFILKSQSLRSLSLLALFL